MINFTIHDHDYNNWLGSDICNVLLKLRPVFSLKTRISFIKEVLQGEPISYCATFKTKKKSIIATVLIGYADGYCRLLSNKAKVLINGKFAPAVGNITMDQFMIDVTDIADDGGISVGDEVVLMSNSKGKNITAEEIANLIGTINYEVVCMLKNRVPRIYIK